MWPLLVALVFVVWLYFAAMRWQRYNFHCYLAAVKRLPPKEALEMLHERPVPSLWKLLTFRKLP